MPMRRLPIHLLSRIKRACHALGDLDVKDTAARGTVCHSRSRLKPLLLALCCCTFAHDLMTVASQGQFRRTPISYPITDAGSKLNLYVEGASKKLNPRVLGPLAKIDGPTRRLLALRMYLRGENTLVLRWSWSAQEIQAYKRSTDYKNAIAEVEKVRTKFAELNPGYSLHVNTEVRSLEAQIKNWNETKSVQAAGDELLAAALTEISGPAYKEVPDRPSLLRFERFLKNHKVVPVPTVAVPGLSPHGQLRAFDFQIQQGDKLIAGTDAALIKDVWDGQGWTQKLRTAVTAASRKFTGPLSSPREPWHYTYTP